MGAGSSGEGKLQCLNTPFSMHLRYVRLHKAYYLKRFVLCSLGCKMNYAYNSFMEKKNLDYYFFLWCKMDSHFNLCYHKPVPGAGRMHYALGFGADSLLTYTHLRQSSARPPTMASNSLTHIQLSFLFYLRLLLCTISNNKTLPQQVRKRVKGPSSPIWKGGDVVLLK